MSTEIIGWASSVILLCTLGRQVWTQYRTCTVEGVSRWLYVGQIAASTGFTLYSALLRNWVFIITNALGVVSAITGTVLYFRNRRRAHPA